MMVGLELLVGQRIESIAVAENIPDLTVQFSEGLRLEVFCDKMAELPSDDVHTIWSDNYCFTFGTTSFSVDSARQVVMDEAGNDP
jgi:hypothetical protein